jgi:pimeloyl-ACP methyl ester carboxylesterase
MLKADMTLVVKKVRAQTLLVWGEHDPAVPLAVGRHLSTLLPCTNLAVIKRTGHVPMWERPDAFNHVLGSFLAGEPITSRPARAA